MRDGTLQDAVSFGLNQPEYKSIIERLGRNPNVIELAIFSVMWSEHCSYKSSKPVFKNFPITGPAVIQGPGENAGAVDIGDGLAAIFKVESHNHPSAIEPYQGAATGVGGIIRDIFTMGARPIVTLDPLFFGSPVDTHCRSLLSGVVSGISGYGNCVGVPNLGGELHIDESYTINPLVNVFCLGIAKHENIRYARASDPGNVVMIIGARTGRDGIHGATFASDVLSKESEEKRSAVQVGDPFLEKLLIEATLELIEKDLVEGVQDLGAAGLTSSSVEMAGRGNRGLVLNIDAVPKRAENMTAYEVMLSESQERMLVIAKPEMVGEISDTLTKWELESAVVGEVTNDGMITVIEHGEVVAQIPIDHLTKNAPVYNLPAQRPDLENRRKEPNGFQIPSWDHANLVKQMASSMNGCSREWVWHQYDTTLLTNTLVPPSLGPGVIRVKGTDSVLAVKSDAKPRFCYLNPHSGGFHTVCEAARNLWACGTKPLAISDCLNFGNPNNPEIFYEIEQSTLGMSEALRELGIPVISGNVSLYNESPQGAVKPTPVVCMVGLGKMGKVNPAHFQNTGDVIILLGETLPELGGSLLYYNLTGKTFGNPPMTRIKEEVKLRNVLLEATDQNLLKSATDLSEGGLASALIECSCVSGLGAQVSLKVMDAVKMTEQLFSESCARALISVSPNNVSQITELAAKHELQCKILGVVGGKTLSVTNALDIPLDELKELYFSSLRKVMDEQSL
jgi:phosphoribosylformylglycinamidine synthase